MSFEMKSSGLPIGSYTVRFVRWETSEHEQYGPRVLFVWEVLDGPLKGQEAFRFTSQRMSAKSALFKIAKGLAGRTFEIGDAFDPNEFLSRKYIVIVGETDSGATRVESVMLATPPAPAAAPAPATAPAVPF